MAGWYLNFPLQVGYDKVGLPIGLQFIGKPWSEATLIHLAYAMQVKKKIQTLLFFIAYTMIISEWRKLSKFVKIIIIKFITYNCIFFL